MNKKIIALALALVLMATVFTACKKYETTEINGNDYLLLTDENGNTVVNSDNNLVAIVTDREGEVLTYSDGEDQTYYIPVYGDTLNDGKSYVDYGEFVIPNGWETDNLGNLYKKGTDKNCHIKLIKVMDIEEDYLDNYSAALNAYLETLDEQNKTIMEEVEKQGYQVESETGTAIITLKTLSSTKYMYKITDKNGDVIHYAENYYFAADDAIFVLEYGCLNGVGYDEEFNFKAYIDTNFVYNG